MYFKQADIFWGMDRDFVKKIMDIGEKESCRGGDFLFQTGDPARYFYILLKGAVKLRREEIGQTVYTAAMPVKPSAGRVSSGGKTTRLRRCVPARLLC